MLALPRPHHRDSMDSHIAHMMPPLGEQSWDPAGGAAAVLEYFQAMRDMHASQLREPIAFTSEQLAVLAAVAPLAPAAFASVLAADHPGLRGRLCGISPTGHMEPDRKEQLTATNTAVKADGGGGSNEASAAGGAVGGATGGAAGAEGVVGEAANDAGTTRSAVGGTGGNSGNSGNDDSPPSLLLRRQQRLAAREAAAREMADANGARIQALLARAAARGLVDTVRSGEGRLVRWCESQGEMRRDGAGTTVTAY